MELIKKPTIKKEILDFTNQEKKEISKLYWNTDSYVKDIAEHYNTKVAYIYKLSGSYKYNCSDCKKEIIQEKRADRKMRYYDKCALCLCLENLNMYYEEVANMQSMLKEVISGHSKAILKYDYDEILEKYRGIIANSEWGSEKLSRLTYKLNSLDLIKPRIGNN